jgi:hypothetical protein
MTQQMQTKIGPRNPLLWMLLDDPAIHGVQINFSSLFELHESILCKQDFLAKNLVN